MWRRLSIPFTGASVDFQCRIKKIGLRKWITRTPCIANDNQRKRKSDERRKVANDTWTNATTITTRDSIILHFSQTSPLLDTSLPVRSPCLVTCNHQPIYQQCKQVQFKACRRAYHGFLTSAKFRVSRYGTQTSDKKFPSTTCVT